MQLAREEDVRRFVAGLDGIDRGQNLRELHQAILHQGAEPAETERVHTCRRVARELLMGRSDLLDNGEPKDRIHLLGLMDILDVTDSVRASILTATRDESVTIRSTALISLAGLSQLNPAELDRAEAAVNEETGGPKWSAAFCLACHPKQLRIDTDIVARALAEGWESPSEIEEDLAGSTYIADGLDTMCVHALRIFGADGAPDALDFLAKQFRSHPKDAAWYAAELVFWAVNAADPGRQLSNRSFAETVRDALDRLDKTQATPFDRLDGQLQTDIRRSLSEVIERGPA